MYSVYHESVLEGVFRHSVQLDNFQKSMLYTSRIALTKKLFDRYAQIFQGDQSFYDWFSILERHDGVYIIPDTVASGFYENLSDPACAAYGVSSYVANQEIVLLDTSGQQANNFKKNHIEPCDFSQYFSQFKNSKNPFKTFRFEKNGSVDFSFLKKYITVEDEIFIYDQYINKQSRLFLEYICSNARVGCYIKVFLYKEDDNCFSTSELNEYFQKFPNVNIRFYKVTSSVAAEIHDRLVAFGKRLLLDFSVGLDQFGAQIRGGRVSFSNRDSTINFYNVSQYSEYCDLSCEQGGKFKMKKRNI